MEGFAMPALRSSTVSASYQMLGSETPRQVMQDWFQIAVENGLVEKPEILNVAPIRGAADFFTIEFKVDVPLDSKQFVSDVFADAKAITDQVVHDTDTVIIHVQFND